MAAEDDKHHCTISVYPSINIKVYIAYFIHKDAIQCAARKTKHSHKKTDARDSNIKNKAEQIILKEIFIIIQTQIKLKVNYGSIQKFSVKCWVYKLFPQPKMTSSGAELKDI